MNLGKWNGVSLYLGVYCIKMPKKIFEIQTYPNINLL